MVLKKKQSTKNVSKKKVVFKPVKVASKKSKKMSSSQIEFKGLLTFLILHELSLKELAGEDLAKKIGNRKGSTLTPGTIYPALKKLKAKKLVVFEKQGRRKVYSLTKKGGEELALSYSLFSKYFYGLKNKIKRVKKANTIKPTKQIKPKKSIKSTKSKNSTKKM